MGEYSVEFGDSGTWALWMRPDRADHGEKISAGLDQRPAILLGDAADRTARHHCRLAPVLEQFRGRPVFGRGLCHAREESAKGDVVGARFRGSDGTVAA